MEYLHEAHGYQVQLIVGLRSLGLENRLQCYSTRGKRIFGPTWNHRFRPCFYGPVQQYGYNVALGFWP